MKKKSTTLARDFPAKRSVHYGVRQRREQSSEVGNLLEKSSHSRTIYLLVLGALWVQPSNNAIGRFINADCT